MKKVILVILGVSILLASCTVGAVSSEDGIVLLKDIRFERSSETLAVRSILPKNILGTGLVIQDALEEPLDGKTVSLTQTYGFTQFQFVSDIFLRSADDFDGDNSYFPLLLWGGDPDDLSKYIDLIAGKVVDDSKNLELPKAKFDSIVLQINAPGDTIKPDFGGDYPEVLYSLGDLKPFYSTISSAQTILLSTYVDTPMVKWISGPIPDAFAASQTVQDYNETYPDDPLLGGLASWVYNSRIPLNQDFFDILKNFEYTEDPSNGEAWLILPLNEPLDFTQYSSPVSINFEFFLDDMMEVHTCTDGSRVFMLSGSKEYSDADGNNYYSPFPLKVTILEE